MVMSFSPNEICVNALKQGCKRALCMLSKPSLFTSHRSTLFTASYTTFLNNYWIGHTLSPQFSL